jgi:hypothetical protein
MKTAIAILSTCLFAGAVLAETPAQTAPVQAPAQTTTPDSSTSPEVAKAAAGHEKEAAKAGARDAKADTKPGKKAKGKAGKKTKPDAGHASKEDTTA